MKIFNYVQVVVSLALVAMVTGQNENSSEPTVEGTNFCSKEEGCDCPKNTEPRQFNCIGMGLQLLYEQSDFLATFEGEDISPNTTLDLRFDENRITEIPVFWPMPVVMLILRHNKISTIEPRAFAELKQLDYLDLSFNDLTSASLTEDVFTGGWNASGYFPLFLTHLNLAHNNIHSLNKNAFDHLNMLKSLDLSHNPLVELSGSTSMAISTLRNLEYLNLADSGVSQMHQGMLHDLLHLTSLDLSGNLFVKVPQELRYTHALTVLGLDRNKFETLDKDSFVGLEALEDLSLVNNEKLKSVEKGTFGPLKNLTKLNLSFCKRLETLNDGAFRGINNDNTTEWLLKEIHLNDNGLSQIDEALCPWEQVDYIDIQQNPFRCDCNLEWMLHVLMPKIEMAQPSLTKNIYCAQPKAMKGKHLVNLMKDNDLFTKCKDSKDELFPEEISVMQSKAAGITIMVIGVILCIVGISMVIFIVVKRRAIATALVAHQEIRYERADSDDDGIGGIHSSAGKNRRNGY